MAFPSTLITGGTGTFGRAFTRQLLLLGCQRVCILSRGEHAQASMAADHTEFHREHLRFFIGDVRDKDRLTRAMQRVSIVVHAAALKRIEVGQYNPTEMVRTNVIGAINVTEAATDARVDKVIMLSTDKAWQPISPYGQSKALAESIFLGANDTRSNDGPRFAVVRYGNVAGSTGSVIPIWRNILQHTDTVPVSDPDCTRFWMRIEEAIAVVLKTAASMQGGELVVPGWLPAYRLGDLAKAMGAKTRVLGLAPWEKKHEGMQDGMTSDKAKRMTVEQLREQLAHV